MDFSLIIKYYANLSTFHPGLDSAAVRGFVFNFALVEKAVNACPEQLRKTLSGVFFRESKYSLCLHNYSPDLNQTLSQRMISFA